MKRLLVSPFSPGGSVRLIRAEVMPDLVLSLGDSVKAGIISKDQLAAKGKFADEWNQA